MSPGTKKILEQVGTWPEEDQDELAEVARAIEARRTGTYVLSDDEQKAIDEARKSSIVPDSEILAFWTRHGVV